MMETQPDPIEVLLTQWEEERRRRKRRNRRLSRWCAILGGLLFGAGVLSRLFLFSSVMGSPVGVILECAVFLLASSLSAHRFNTVPLDLLDTLMTPKDARVLPALNEALLHTQGIRRTHIRNRILELVAWAGDCGGIETSAPLLTLFEQALGQTRTRAASALAQVLTRLHQEQAVEALPPMLQERLLQLLSPSVAGLHPETALALLPLLPFFDAKRALTALIELMCESLSAAGRQVRETARPSFANLLDRADFGGEEQVGFWIDRMSDAKTAIVWEQVVEPMLALMQLLPRLSPEGFRSLLPIQRNRLYALLLRPYLEGPFAFRLLRFWPATALSVLKLVQQTRDQKSVYYLQWLEAGEGFGRLPEVREAATECLAALKEAKQQEQTSKVLLRGSDAPPTASGELLRAARSDAVETDPSQLLRADVSGSRDDVLSKSSTSLQRSYLGDENEETPQSLRSGRNTEE